MLRTFLSHFWIDFRLGQNKTETVMVTKPSRALVCCMPNTEISNFTAVSGAASDLYLAKREEQQPGLIYSHRGAGSPKTQSH